MNEGGSKLLIVVGCNHVGSGLAQAMNERGHHVNLVDSNPDAFRQLGSGFRGKTITGIGFDRDVLLVAGVEHADALVAVTASDETNVVTAQVARQVFHVPKVVARVNHPRQADIYQRLGLQTIAPTTWGITRIAELLCHSQLETVLSFGNGEVDMVVIEITPSLAGKMVKDVSVLGEISVVAIVRDSKAFLPSLGTRFESGDHVHVAVMNTWSQRLNELLGLA